MVNERSDPASLDGWMDTLGAQQERNSTLKQNSDLKYFTNSTTAYIPPLNY